MKIGYFSDLHGDLRSLKALETRYADVMVCGGDLFPDGPGGYGAAYNVREEYQLKWWNKHKNSFIESMDGKPVLWVRGNHDVCSLYKLMQHIYPDVHDITPSGVVIDGIRFSGFGNTPVDTDNLTIDRLILKTLDSNPDVLVTHGPPSTILDHGRPEWGLNGLAHYLRNKKHSIKLHLFGHVHEDGGKNQKASYGTAFYNGAQRLTFIDL